MAEIIFEFGTENIEGITDAAEIAVESAQYQVSVTMASEKESLIYAQTQDTLKSAIQKIQQGSLTSFLLFPKSGPIKSALVCIPHFLGDPMPFWFGSLEYEGPEWEILFNRLLEVEQLQFLSVSVEEGPELAEQTPTVSTFPWHHWCLLLGAIRTRSSTANDWVIRRGPAYPHIRDQIIR